MRTDDAILRYYQEEMSYLRDAGAQFARTHPNSAKYLNFGTHSESDPSVDRLFEGFAFLTARIRQRLDDDLSVYTESLLGVVYPTLVRAVPSAALVELRPKRGMVSATTTVPRGTDLRAAAYGDENTVCRFQTTTNVQLHPIELRTATLDRSENTLTLRFHLEKGVELGKLSLGPLRIYLHSSDDAAIPPLLHLFLTRHVDRVEWLSADGGAAAPGSVAPAGFGPDDALLPSSPYAFRGFQLLQEYFAFRQKFWFVDLAGIDGLVSSPKMTAFDARIHFNRSFPDAKPIKATSFRLYCTPVVNLFTHDAAPLKVDHRASEYRVVADVGHPTTIEVYDVKQVLSVEDGTGNRREYRPYIAAGTDQPETRWFTTNQRTAADNRLETFLTLGGVQAGMLRPETVSAEVECTNGNWPFEWRDRAPINALGPNVPQVATVAVNVQPTKALRPPLHLHAMLYWRLISHLSLSHRSVATVDGLKDLLRLYDWTDDPANERRIEGIRDVKWASKERVVRRACVRGAEVIVEIQDAHFADEGDVCLFGLVLSRVLGAYATINSFVDLTVVLMPSGARYEWRRERGDMSLV